MTATRPEKDIKHLDDKELLNYIYTHIDRAQYENMGAMKNIYFAKFEKTQEGLQEKLIAGQGYGIDQTEHLTNLRFAIKALHLRWLRTKRAKYMMEQNFKKLRQEKVEHEEVELPDLWSVE